MCLGKAYLNEQAAETLIVENITSLVVSDEGVVITTLLGEQKYVEGKVEYIDFSKSRVILSPVNVT